MALYPRLYSCVINTNTVQPAFPAANTVHNANPHVRVHIQHTEL